MRQGQSTELTVLRASTEGITFALPADVLAPPRVGQMLHLLLEAHHGSPSALVRADVLEIVGEPGELGIVCAFRATDASPGREPVLVREQPNRRETFRVRPKAGEQVEVELLSGDVRIAGWMIDVSIGGMRIAATTRDLLRFSRNQRVQLRASLPGNEVPLQTECTVSRNASTRRPFHCAVEFAFPSRHSEAERLIVSYVMRRQREMIRMIRGEG